MNNEQTILGTARGLNIISLNCKLSSEKILIEGRPLWLKRGGPPCVIFLYKYIFKRDIYFISKTSSAERWRVPDASASWKQRFHWRKLFVFNVLFFYKSFFV